MTYKDIYRKNKDKIHGTSYNVWWRFVLSVDAGAQLCKDGPRHFVMFSDGSTHYCFPRVTHTDDNFEHELIQAGPVREYNGPTLAQQYHEAMKSQDRFAHWKLWSAFVKKIDPKAWINWDDGIVEFSDKSKHKWKGRNVGRPYKSGQGG